MYAWVVTLGFNGGCKPWDTRTCLQGWPDHPVDLQQRWYMLLMFGYYLYEMIGTAVNVGTKLKADMREWPMARGRGRGGSGVCTAGGGRGEESK